MQSLIELNGFVKNVNGVYNDGDDKRGFNYSDGESTEIQLHKILSSADDLSSNSPELQAHIVDWPTEYHLASSRANLLRPLKLDGVTRVLELGCGCGSITRYLAEQDGVHIDAVEGSPIRAGLAALRCRDLSNVTISTANFNEISFPENYYDLVLFVGVTEYAGRFSNRETDQEALQDLLALGQSAVKTDGAVLVAIENRIGLKYLLGASEDHYAVSYVGLDDYPESTGIRTYTKPEWLEQIAEAGFSASEFIYPFPDYKVPTVLLKDGCSAKTAEQALSDVDSRDYCHPFSVMGSESRIWQGLAESQSLGEHANSFLILVGQNQASLNSLADFEIAQYPVAKLGYLDKTTIESQPAAPQKPTPKRNAAVTHLEAQLAELRQHSSDLQQTIDVMAGSSGWKLLKRLRRVFGIKSIR